MWKKEETTPQPAAPQPEAPRRVERTQPASGSGDVATIGRSIAIQGQVTGDEDLLIQGKVDGSVDLKQHAITVGPDGEVKASIVGRVVTVEGKVEGNITADEQVILRTSASVQGDITAPRVVLEDGSRFRGGIDMGETGGRGGRSDVSAASLSRTTTTSRPGTESPVISTDKAKSEKDAGTEVRS